MERKLVKIGEAAALIGSTPATLRKWEATGELIPARKTKGGTRYYAVADLLALGDADAPTICYARVSSHDQKSDLDRQHELDATHNTRIFTKKELDELNSALLLSSVVLEYIKKHNVNLYNDINENMSLNT